MYSTSQLSLPLECPTHAYTNSLSLSLFLIRIPLPSPFAPFAGHPCMSTVSALWPKSSPMPLSDKSTGAMNELSSNVPNARGSGLCLTGLNMQIPRHAKRTDGDSERSDCGISETKALEGRRKVDRMGCQLLLHHKWRGARIRELLEQLRESLEGREGRIVQMLQMLAMLPSRSLAMLYDTPV